MALFIFLVIKERKFSTIGYKICECLKGAYLKGKFHCCYKNTIKIFNIIDILRIVILDIHL